MKTKMTFQDLYYILTGDSEIKKMDRINANKDADIYFSILIPFMFGIFPILFLFAEKHPFIMMGYFLLIISLVFLITYLQKRRNAKLDLIKINEINELKKEIRLKIWSKFNSLLESDLKNLDLFDIPSRHFTHYNNDLIFAFKLYKLKISEGVIFTNENNIVDDFIHQINQIYESWSKEKYQEVTDLAKELFPERLKPILEFK